MARMFLFDTMTASGPNGTPSTSEVSVRDLMAIACLPSVFDRTNDALSREGEFEHFQAQAKRAYDLADAMLMERERKPEMVTLKKATDCNEPKTE